MRVILLKDIKGVGKKFEEKEVSNGHATNLLIPKKLAVSLAGASATNIKNLKEQEEKIREKERRTLTENLSKIAGLKLEIKMKANEQGHLFEKITAGKVSEILKKEKGIEINPEQILLKNSVKEIGTFEIPVGKTHLTLEVRRA
ncbi:MAG: 50S ribosomal protein L9 [Patescibacteria group bacterium]|nr:50S ribosomal protein L9 [Patescibacteria group bacterium]